MTTVEEAILARRSTKFFEDRPIDAALLDRIIELTLAAPSSFNLQPWRIVVIREPEQRAAIRAASYHQPQFEHAPVTLVFAVTLEGWRDHLQEVTDQGFSSGAWPTEFEETIRTSIDGFQTDLERRGKIREYAIKDAMIAATHTVLAAESLGV
ncbi:MAG: nitroreductase family protein, partial [Planctomycetota bacterium]